MTGPASNPAGAAKTIAEELMPKRAAFINWAAGRGLDVMEDVDAWGQRKFAHSHIDAMWTGWFNASAASVVTETSLVDLRDLLARAAWSGQAINLSPNAAGALHSAMTTPPASRPASETMQEVRTSLDEAMASDELRQLKAEAQALAADGANWSMHVGCEFFLAVIERIESLTAAQPAGYIARADVVKLGNCRAELWAAPPAADAVAVYFGAPPAPADVCAEMRALCSNCGGAGDVHRIDGEWMGECTCALAVADRDAARYRWLRNQMSFSTLSGAPAEMNLRAIIPAPDHNCHTDWMEERFDASVDRAVDAAMRAAAPAAEVAA